MILKDGTDFYPDMHSVTMLRKAYPNIQIEQEISKMDAWCLCNPGRRKTKRGALSFINSWLSRAIPNAKPSTRTRDRSLEDDLTDRSWAT